MTWDNDDDSDLVSKYRVSFLDGPDPALDRKVLRAAARARLRKRLWPVALATAASLTLLWAMPRQSAPPAVSYHRSTAHDAVPGLYDGRIARELADPAMTQQSMAAQMPGGSEGESNHGS